MHAAPTTQHPPRFTGPETAACLRIIQWALDEDFGAKGDLTSQATIPADLTGSGTLMARADGVLAGIPAAALVVNAVDQRLQLQAHKEDGALIRAGEPIAVLAGPMRALLAAERTTLNFLQHLSGIATLTQRYVQQIKGLRCVILDTRKTLPGWRVLEKYAVCCGGGHNHRVGLYDGILIKDNHLAALGKKAGTITQAVHLARQRAGHTMPLEIEVDNLEQFDEALACGPDIILLDNMPTDHLREAVRRRDARAGTVLLEASGGVNLDTVRSIAETGVDRISVGALTHSAPALDIALDYQG